MLKGMSQKAPAQLDKDMKVFKDKFKDPESRNKRKRDVHPREVGTNNGAFTSIRCTNKFKKN